MSSTWDEDTFSSQTWSLSGAVKIPAEGSDSFRSIVVEVAKLSSSSISVVSESTHLVAVWAWGSAIHGHCVFSSWIVSLCS